MKYNPFIPFTEEVLYGLRNEHTNFLIVQRFSWPGLNRSSTFLVTVYYHKEMATEHAQHLEANEGRLIDISKEFDKVLALLQPGSLYRLFTNKFSQTNWERRMLKEYQWKIQDYLARKTSLRPKDKIDISFKLLHGRMVAIIEGKDTLLEVPAIDIII